MFNSFAGRQATSGLSTGQQNWADAAERIRRHNTFEAVLRDDSLVYYVSRTLNWAESVASFLFHAHKKSDVRFVRGHGFSSLNNLFNFFIEVWNARRSPEPFWIWLDNPSLILRFFNFDLRLYCAILFRFKAI